ncbi:MAG: HAMP domain-containing protein, partial [Clostridiales bacterium]|nr:HAMP domain-containing protein [Candidatus Blautia equi]
MKKISLQARLTLLSALLLTICCVTLDILIMNSAIMKLEEVGDSIPYIKIDNNEDSYVINLPSTYPEIQNALATTKEGFRRQCFIITAIIIAIGTMLTWVISGIALRPLKNLNRSIGEISASNLSTELPETGGSDEIATLTHSFNHMLCRINDAFLSQKQFSANAAHELR